jgi:hypothetical protein
MTPDDVSTVQRSWAELRRHRVVLVGELARCFADLDDSTIEPVIRAGWLCSAIDELVGLLSSPTSLAARACEMGRSFPDRLTAPSFVVDGRAWLQAAGSCAGGWSEHSETAWRKAWLLLSDALAEETLSPFADGWHPGRSTHR